MPTNSRLALDIITGQLQVARSSARFYAGLAKHEPDPEMAQTLQLKSGLWDSAAEALDTARDCVEAIVGLK